MRIVHVIATLAAAHGGPPRACIGMARALVARGHTVSIETTSIAMTPGDRAMCAALRAEGIAVGCHAPAWPQRWARSPGLAAAVARAAESADVLHCHALHLHHDLAAWRAARRMGVPLVLTPHGGLSAHVRRRGRARKALAGALFQREMLAGAAALHCLGPAEAADLAALGFGGRVAVVPPLVDAAEEAVPRGRFRERFGIAEAVPLVLFLGRLAPGKGVEALVQAFAQAAQGQGDAVLVLAGPDFGAAAGAQAAAEVAGLGSRVILTGALDRRTCAEALADADVFALLSEGESFGIAALEAMAAGVPVLLSPQVPLAAVAEAAGAGLVAGHGDAGEALAHLLSDAGRRGEMGQAGRRHVLAHHGRDAVGAELETLYARVIADRRVRNAA
ncbi:glycosyltransferase [Futiania mangrovi]|uniref:Glycosyltransferase n=1 Tax=Futiania mangrovi TaxID=2959716 RepID=A0A9J6P985_9PROT|nr:glycosyltransferase [Futiania mangrovii]MCP1335365.1 glycosyltransferase [Futiania mangrovii]